MRIYHEGSTCGMLCQKCGWGWVTTYSSPIDEDETMYAISFCKHEKATASMIKTYAKSACLDFIQAKKELEEGRAKFSASAADFQKHVDEIRAAEMRLFITQDYQYDISQACNE